MDDAGVPNPRRSRARRRSRSWIRTGTSCWVGTRTATRSGGRAPTTPSRSARSRPPTADRGGVRRLPAAARSARSWALTLAKWIAIVGAVAWALSGIALAAVYLGFEENGPGSFTGLREVGAGRAVGRVSDRRGCVLCLHRALARPPQGLTTGLRRPASDGRDLGPGRCFRKPPARRA